MSDSAKQTRGCLDNALYKESKLCEFSAIVSEYEEEKRIKQIRNQDKENEIKQKQLNKALNKIYKICRKHAKKGSRQCKIVLLNYNFLGLVHISAGSCCKFDYVFVADFIAYDKELLKSSIKEELLLCSIDMYAKLDFPVLTVSWDK